MAKFEVTVSVGGHQTTQETDKCKITVEAQTRDDALVKAGFISSVAGMFVPAVDATEDATLCKEMGDIVAHTVTEL